MNRLGFKRDVKQWKNQNWNSERKNDKTKMKVKLDAGAYMPTWLSILICNAEQYMRKER